MTTPTVAVTVTLAEQDGTPIAGVTVRARLDANEVYQGIVVSAVEEAVTDGTGVAILNCFPNAPSPTGLGTQGSTYTFTATVPGGRSVNVQARVPNLACRLETILVDNDGVSLDAAQLALLQVQAFAAEAGTARDQAQAVLADTGFQAVVGITSQIETVAASISSVTTVAGSIANVNTVAGAVVNVSNVAGSIANVNTVAGSIANVNTVAANVTPINTVAVDIAAVRGAEANATLAVGGAATATAQASAAATSAANAAAAAASSGSVVFYDTYALANAAVAGLANLQIVEVFADETRTGSPRTRYQKVGGVLVFKLDLSATRTQLDSFKGQNPAVFKVGPFLSNIRTKTTGSRVLLTGTSIASFDTSALQIIGRLLQRVYGANETDISNMGAYGGTYAPSSGHKKQVFGGPSYYRMAMGVGESDIVFTDFVDGFNVVYGKEGTGGSFDIYIDGVFDSTLNSNGSQAYELVYTKTFASRGVHTLTIKAPASGVAYLQRVEMVRTGAGVYIENATLGGSALWNAASLITDGQIGNAAGIAIVGNNGIDALSARAGVCAPDIIICEHFTNDTQNVSDFQAMLARLVANTKAAGIPLVLVTEQPAVAYVSGTGGALTSGPQQILNTILSYREEKHVTVIDWTEMVDYSDKTAYDAKYYPTGDKTHPTSAGHALPTQALAELFEVSNPGQQSALGARYTNGRPEYALVPPVATDDAYATRYNKPGEVLSVPGDGLHGKSRQIIGRSRDFAVGRPAAVLYSEDTPNLVALADATAISGSGTSDAYGPYITLVSDTVFVPALKLMTATSVEQEMTLVLLASWVPGGAPPSLKLNTTSNNAVPRVYVNGSAYGNATGAIPSSSRLLLPSDAPALVHLTWRHNAVSSPFVGISVAGSNMKVYGAWITEGSVPLITPRFLATYRQIGFPLYMTGDAVPANVTPGQAYLEAINSITVEKVALNTVCWKPLTSTYGRVYEMRNKGTIFCQRVDPLTPSTLAYRDKVGGEAYNSVAGSPSWQLTGAFTTFPFSKRFTLGMRMATSLNLTHGVRIAFLNGSSNTYTYLQANGTWATQVGGNSSTLPNLVVGSNFLDGLNVAWTFDMPDSATFSTALGANPQLNIYLSSAGSVYFAPAVLAEGNSAIARWT